VSEPLPPGDNWTMTPTAKPDVRDIDMNQLPSGPSSASNPPSPFPDVIYTRDGRTMVRQPDGSYAFTPDQPAPPWMQPNQPPPPWMQPAAAATTKSSLLGGHGLMVALATLATVAIVGVGLNMTSGHDNPSAVPPAYATRASMTPTTHPGLATSTVLIDSGAARANQIVAATLKGCLSQVDQDQFELVLEAVPGVDLDRVYQALPNNPDHLFIPDSADASDLYTVTITATGSRNHGAKGRWGVDISTGGIVPLMPFTIADGAPALYGILLGRGCGTIQEMM
jgi:hypothetical protein